VTDGHRSVTLWHDRTVT